MDINIHIRKCNIHGITNRKIINSLLCSSDFDPRVTIAIGIMRWLMDYQISEIQILLESRGISISTGEISNLSREFLLRFYCIHRRHMKDMELKEYMLHLDRTGESGGEIVFMAKDGITGIIMLYGFVDNTQYWMEQYHMRSISESVNSMMKRKMPVKIRKKLPQRKKTEETLSRSTCTT